jgi:hypothetical protein
VDIEGRNIWNWVKTFLFSKTNRDLSLFLFFLALSGVFWLFLTLNESYEKEFQIPVTITNVPKNVVLTSDETDTVKMTIRDKGFTLATYLYGNALPHIYVDYKSYVHPNGIGIIPSSDLQKLVRQQLASGSKITAVKTEKLEFYYNFGDKKRVPIRWSGRVIPEQLYFISHVEYVPDSVTVYASKEKLDSISVIYTEQLNYANFRDTLMVNCRLAKQKGIKTIPEEVRVEFYTDVLTEESMEGVPIRGFNMPKGKVLRTFPAKMTVHFVTGASVFRSLKPEDFVIIADYNELKDNPSTKCRIYLKTVPPGISRARLESSQVDYLIEEQNTE